MVMAREYLVHIRIETPSSMPDEELADLRRREHDAAQLLAARGWLHRLWRVPHAWENWGLWRAHDEKELSAVLATLPMHPYMTITAHPTDPHPSDPASRGRSGRGSPTRMTTNGARRGSERGGDERSI
jgi:muconolactone delta-isomerase